MIAPSHFLLLCPVICLHLFPDTCLPLTVSVNVLSINNLLLLHPPPHRFLLFHLIYQSHQNYNHYDLSQSRIISVETERTVEADSVFMFGSLCWPSCQLHRAAESARCHFHEGSLLFPDHCYEIIIQTSVQKS